MHLEVLCLDLTLSSKDSRKGTSCISSVSASSMNQLWMGTPLDSCRERGRKEGGMEGGRDEGWRDGGEGGMEEREGGMREGGIEEWGEYILTVVL